MIVEDVEFLVAVVLLLLLGYGLYRLYRALREIRDTSNNYQDQISGIGEYPVEISPGEDVLFDSRGRDIGWKVVMILGILISALSIVTIVLIFFLYWGFSLIVYANDQRKASNYIFTTKRLIEIEASGSITEYDYGEVRQLQTDAAGYEKLINAGHLKFSTGASHKLHQIGSIRHPSNIARRLEEGIESY